MDRTLAEKKLKDNLDENDQLPCKEAHGIAEEFGVSPKSIGDLVTESGLKICRCQLGLFGYAEKKNMPGFRKVHRMGSVPAEVEAEVRKAVQKNKIACVELWRIGTSMNVPRTEMGNTAETLSLKVSPCQLGCF